MPVDTSNYIYRMGTAPNTRAAISQKCKIYGYSVGNTPGFKQIGALTEFGFDESRTIDPIRGIGYGDQIAELVPSVTEPMTITANKTLLYAVNLFQVFGYKGGIDGIARSLKHHRWPFDIKQELVFSELSSSAALEAVGANSTGAATNAQAASNQIGVQNATVFKASDTPITAVKALFTFFEACWFNSYSASFTSDAAIVTENSSITVTDILDGFSSYGEFVDTGLSPGQAGQGYSLRFAGNSNQAPTANG